MKVILGTGDLLTLRNVARASFVAMMAGADFIKTSTGKEPTKRDAAGRLRDDASHSRIRAGDRYGGRVQTGRRNRTAKQSIEWLALMKEETRPLLDESGTLPLRGERILNDIERQLEHYATGRYSADYRTLWRSADTSMVTSL